MWARQLVLWFHQQMLDHNRIGQWQSLAKWSLYLRRKSWRTRRQRKKSGAFLAFRTTSLESHLMLVYTVHHSKHLYLVQCHDEIIWPFVLLWSLWVLAGAVCEEPESTGYCSTTCVAFLTVPASWPTSHPLPPPHWKAQGTSLYHTVRWANTRVQN